MWADRPPSVAISAHSRSQMHLQYNVDALAAVPGSNYLVAGLSNFIGRYWTGGIALLPAPEDDADGLHSLVELRGGVPAIAMLPTADSFTGRHVLASGSDDGSLELWYLTHKAAAGQGLERTQLTTFHNDAVTSLAAAPSGAALASASADGTVRLWDCGQLLSCTAQLGAAGASPGAANAIAWLSGGGGGDNGGSSTLASAHQSGRVCLWDSRQLSSTPAAWAAVGAPVLSLLVAAPRGDGEPVVVTGDELGGVAAWDPRHLAAPVQQQQLFADAVHALACSGGSGGTGSSGSGSNVAVAASSDDGSVQQLDLQHLEASKQLLPPRQRQQGEAPCYMRALAWAGGRLYRGGWDKTVSAVPL